MKNSILKLKNGKKLSRNEQISILGGSSSCFITTCGITKEQCDDLQGFYNKKGCCGYVPLSQNC